MLRITTAHEFYIQETRKILAPDEDLKYRAGQDVWRVFSDRILLTPSGTYNINPEPLSVYKHMGTRPEVVFRVNLDSIQLSFLAVDESYFETRKGLKKHQIEEWLKEGNDWVIKSMTFARLRRQNLRRIW